MSRQEAVTFVSLDPSATLGAGPPGASHQAYPRTPRAVSIGDMERLATEAPARKRRLSESEYDTNPSKMDRRGLAALAKEREDGESTEPEHAVEAVMGYRFEKGQAQLLVKWEGETMRKSTWEPLTSFNDLEAALELWHEGRDNAPDVESLIEEDDLADAQPSVPRSNGHLPDRATAAGAPGSAPAFSGATPSRGDTPTPATSGVPVPGTVPFGRSRPRKPNRNEVVSGDPTLKHEQRESSLGPTNKIPARQHGRFAQKIIGGRCSACVKTKKGSCGTATAPRSCLRLQEGQRATSILPTLPPLPHHIYADQPKNDPYRALDDFILRWEEPPQPPRRPQEDEEEYPEEYYYDGSEGGGEEEAEAPEETDNAEGEGRRKPSPPTPSGGSGGSGSREDAE